MKVLKGNLLQLVDQGMFDVAVHGCNCEHKMGGGIAKDFKLTYPEVSRADRATPVSTDKLGTFSVARVKTASGAACVILNAYTQASWRGNGCKVSEENLRSVFRAVREQFHGARIGYPKIAAGRGGGDWAQIARVIDEELAGEDHTLVEFDRQDDGLERRIQRFGANRGW